MDDIVVELQPEPVVEVETVQENTDARFDAPHEARILALEERIKFLAERLNLVLELKKHKLDISNFTFGLEPL